MAIPTVPYALVIDDDPLIDACLRHPEGAGFCFHEAGTGDEAKTFLGHHADDVTLLFSDVAMPGDTNGFARTHYVAEHRPWIEIVIASGK